MSKKVGAPLAKPVKEATVAPQTISWRTHLFRVYIGLAMVGLIILGLAAHGIPYFSADLIIAKFLQTLPLGGVMSLISWPGYPPQAAVFIVGSVILLALLGLYWEAIVAAVGFGVMEITVNVLKSLVGRVRPLATLVNVDKPLSGGSFPSGHVVDYVVVLGFFWFLVFTSFKKSSLVRRLLMIVFTVLIVLIGPSRVYLGEHWPSDTLGAYLLGSVILWLMIEFYRYGRARHWVKSAIQ